MRTFKQYETDIIKTIKEKNIFTIEMLFAFYSGISRSQFYNMKLNKSDNIKKALDDNKNRTKQSLLAKWFKSDNATLQIALFKILGTEEEYYRLSSTKYNIEGTLQEKKNTIRDLFPTDEEHKELEKAKK